MITVEFKGNIGNQLFQYAACRSLAETNSFDFHIPKSFAGNEILNLNCSLGNEMFNIINIFYENSAFKYEQNFYNISDNTILNGFFQSEKYFCKEKVKNWFKQPYNETAEYFLNQYKIDEYCYIHFRATDYITTPYWLPKSYYDNAKNEIKNINNEIKFIIITDDVTYAKNYFPNDLIKKNDVIVDFYLLSHAKYIITSNSSFSWWSVYLNDICEKVIGPLNWLNYNNNLDVVGFAPEYSEIEKIMYII